VAPVGLKASPICGRVANCKGHLWFACAPDWRFASDPADFPSPGTPCPDLGFTRSALLFLATPLDRKSTRLNSSHVKNSYAVFCWLPPAAPLFPYTTLFRSGLRLSASRLPRFAGGSPTAKATSGSLALRTGDLPQTLRISRRREHPVQTSALPVRPSCFWLHR